MDLGIDVLNATGVAGVAAQMAQQLTGVGYTNVNSGNYPQQSPSVNSVFYKNESDLNTANDVASVLGFSAVALDPELESDIEVVIVE
jgi:hypothetical protein